MIRGTGYRPVPWGVRQDPWHLHRLAAASAPLPDAVDLKTFRPPIFNQGATGSCVGHGTASAIMTSLAAAGTPVKDLLCPLSVYRLARCMERSWSKPDLDNLPPLRDVGTDPDMAMRAVSTWGIDTCKRLLGVDGPGDEYTAKLEAQVNREPMLGELEASDAFKVVGQQAIYSTGKQLLDDVARALAARCAVGFSVYASDDRFQSYVGGILGPPPAKWPDHWVYLTGYYTDATGHRVYLGANSWSEEWGERGEFAAHESVILASDCLEVFTVRRSA